MPNPNRDPTTWVVEADLPEWGLRVGDVVTLDWRSRAPVWVARELPPNFGGLLDLWERGLLTLSSACEPDALRLRLRPAVPDEAAPATRLAGAPSQSPGREARVLPLRTARPRPPDPGR